MLAEQTQEIKIGNYQDIVQQIGSNKFLTMTGSKFKYHGYDKNGYVYLMIELAKNQSGAKYLKIQLNGLDLYNMIFSKIKKTLNPEYKKIGLKIYDEEIVTVKTYTDIYAEDLQRMFTDVTGMYTKLF